MSESRDFVLGVDIGGTKIAAGLVDSNGVILYSTRVKMNALGSAAEGLSRVVNAIETALRDNPGVNVRAIGLSAPGPLDPNVGVVTNPPNLPCWRDYPLLAELGKHFSLPMAIDNDANAAAYAETLWGAGRGYKNVFYATIGTGVGTGMSIDGKLYNGRTGAAPEAGHITIDYRGPTCGCGKKGCIEVLGSGTAIARRAREAVNSDPHRGAALLAFADGNAELITSELVKRAWLAGDPLSSEVLQQTCFLWTVWLGNVIDVLEPDVIVIGGGAGELMMLWIEEIRAGLPHWSIHRRCNEIPIVRAFYGAESGIAGGAAVVASSSQLSVVSSK
jgi:glucokinase